MTEHEGKKPFRCKNCNQGFVHKQSFEAHQRKHDGVVLKCKLCSKPFHDAGYLKKHLRWHERIQKIRNDVWRSINTENKGTTFVSFIYMWRLKPENALSVVFFETFILRGGRSHPWSLGSLRKFVIELWSISHLKLQLADRSKLYYKLPYGNYSSVRKLVKSCRLYWGLLHIPNQWRIYDFKITGAEC